MMNEAEEARLAAAEKEFGDWDFHPVLGGWLAVPAGTPVIRGMFLETVMEKLEKLRDRQ